VTDAEVKAYYDAHPAEFKEEMKFELAQVVVEKPETAAEVEAKVKDKVPFEELAAAYSLDKVNSDKGGYVGVLTRTQLEKEFASVALLTEGQVSAPVQSPRGYHIVKVLAVKPERQLTFDEAKDAVREKTLDEKRRAAQQRWVKKLRENSVIEVSDAGIVAYQEEQLRRLREDEAKKTAKEAEAKAVAEEKEAAAKAAPAPAKPAAQP
jgi:parvulin-like peptidyl-prolyl isomerase